jgi:HK97 gp10 family phage protein
MSAGMKVKSEVIGLDKFRDQLTRMGKAARGNALKDAAMAGGQVVEAYARINANSVFSSKATNYLAGSIHTEIVRSDDTSVEVAIGSNVEHARIHELGGTIKPVFKKMLSWVNDQGERVFANVVHMPARPYLRPALDEHHDDIRDGVGHAIKKNIEAAL